MLLPVITAPAGFAGLVKLSHAVYRGEHVDLNIFWCGVCKNLRQGTILGIISLLVVVVNISNLNTYVEPTPFSSAIRTIWLGAILVWFALMFYFWPIYYEMDQPGILGALRNAALMIALNPIFTLIHLAGLVAIVAISIAVPPFSILLGFAFVAILSTQAVFDRLTAAGYKHSRSDTFTEYNA